MRKLLLVLFCIPLLLPAQENKKNILDYYQLMDISETYPLTLDGEEWITRSLADYEMVATVDIPNGFIEILDDGSGGGTHKVQVVLYRKQDGTDLIAYSDEVFDGITLKTQLKFTEYDGEWKDVTETVWPGQNVNKKLTPPQLEGLPDEIADQVLYVSTELPQKGTTIRCSLIPIRFEMVCGGMIGNGDLFKAIKNYCGQDVDWSGYASFRWDSVKGVFKAR